jgi:hypothetical protein
LAFNKNVSIVLRQSAKAEKKFWKYFYKSAKIFRIFLGTNAKSWRFNFKEKYCSICSLTVQGDKM